MNTTKKKILYAASEQSHLERFHQPYLKELRKEHEVFTMANGADADFPIRFSKSSFGFSAFCNLLRIRRILNREKFDAILLHTAPASVLVRAATFGMRRRPYILNVVHGYPFQKEANDRRARRLLRREKKLRKCTDDIAVMNGEDLSIAQAHKLCRGKICLINGMGLPPLETLPVKSKALRAAYTEKENDFICTCIGELSERKNLTFLICATQRLVEEGIPIKLLLIGEGEERELLEEEIRERMLEDYVFLTGAKTPILPYLSITDLYVSASTAEGLSFSIMEAMSCGLPIAASDTKGQTDLLKDTIALYPAEDEDGFCDLVRHVYASGRYGIGTRQYPHLKEYTLPAVFENNMKVFTVGWDQK